MSKVPSRATVPLKSVTPGPVTCMALPLTVTRKEAGMVPGRQLVRLTTQVCVLDVGLGRGAGLGGGGAGAGGVTTSGAAPASGVAIGAGEGAGFWWSATPMAMAPAARAPATATGTRQARDGGVALTDGGAGGGVTAGAS